MFFEIKYSAAIFDASNRRATISKAQRFHMVGKSRNVLLSSEAQSKLMVRSPHDVSNLGLIFGLSEEQAKSSILSLGRKVLLSAECRRLGRCPVLLNYIDLNSTDDEDDGDSSSERMSIDQDLSKSNKRLSTRSNEKSCLENVCKKAKVITA